MGADTEAASVHRGFQQSLSGWAAVLIGAQQFGGAGEVLRDPSAAGGPGESLCQQSVAIFCELRGGRQRRGIEDLGHGQCASGQQLPRAAVRIRVAECRKGGVLARVLGPEGAQH
ncbi:hypothetical protein AMK20_27240 [Streptomyces sp. TSRI0261]|nr:hypothetical protein AMK20_27240 [Streptomyces sp. TSRI0261]